MALLTPQSVPVSGIALTYGSVAASDTVTPNAGQRFILYVKNANASPDTVTIAVPGLDPLGRVSAVQTVTVTNGTEKAIYLAPQPALTDGTTGLITVTHSVTSSVTCAVMQIPN